MESREDPTQVLRAVFGHPSFRPGQRETIEAVLRGRDCLAVMPTGAGKSLTYQLPARMLPGCTVVVSPLIALMRDQVGAAVRRGLGAASIDSTMSEGERERVLAAAMEGGIELLYCSPEGLPGAIESLGRRSRVSLFAVDEAHCISQWGHDFRPAYRQLGEARLRLGGVPALAVTATATMRVADDIVENLGLRDAARVRNTFMRSNLRLSAMRRDRLTGARESVLRAVERHPFRPGIVYCLSRRGAGTMATWLRRMGVAAGVYHAGMPDGPRGEVQEAFLAGDLDVIVATVAFGMGVDKPDVRFVVHADMPGSVEAYAQEVGRAGRDGAPSDCVLLFSWDDVRRWRSLTSGLPVERRREAMARVREMYGLAAGVRCRHQVLCGYFGEEVQPCRDACDVCLRRTATTRPERSRTG